MQHTISLDEIKETYGPFTQGMVNAIEACVHCGFCLPTCPTYQVLGEEMDSPRGRIVLMKTALEGGLTSQDALPYIDRCLGCMSCVTACPSGVRYEELLYPFRARARSQARMPAGQKASRALASATLPFPARFRAAANLSKIARPFQQLLPAEMRSMLELLPGEIPARVQFPEVTPAQGQVRGRVALLAGCAQQVLAPEINLATIRVLSRNGVEVVVPANQACCGAILHHAGDIQGARKLGRQNLDAFHGIIDGEFDALINNAAGCGAGLKEYRHLFLGLPEEEDARILAEKSQDISVYLASLGLVPIPELPKPIRAVYHDACHLSHGQGVVAQPRQLLGAIPNLTILPIPNSEICCGSAGTYNLEQPAIANELGRLKAEAILATGAEMVVAGNIGCLVQIRNSLEKAGAAIPVVHIIELLDMAYQRANAG